LKDPYASDESKFKGGKKTLKQYGLNLLPWPNTNGFNLLAAPNNKMGLGCWVGAESPAMFVAQHLRL